jgi:hypothetical protein
VGEGGEGGGRRREKEGEGGRRREKEGEGGRREKGEEKIFPRQQGTLTEFLIEIEQIIAKKNKKYPTRPMPKPFKAPTPPSLSAPLMGSIIIPVIPS